MKVRRKLYLGDSSKTGLERAKHGDDSKKSKGP